MSRWSPNRQGIVPLTTIGKPEIEDVCIETEFRKEFERAMPFVMENKPVPDPAVETPKPFRSIDDDWIPPL